jgi:hypothetical protein
MNAEQATAFPISRFGDFKKPIGNMQLAIDKLACLLLIDYCLLLIV